LPGFVLFMGLSPLFNGNYGFLMVMEV
jgi:hypothetical protein